MDWYSGLPQIMPLGISEISGVPVGTEKNNYVDSACRSDLLKFNDSPINIRVFGGSYEVLTLEACDNSLLKLKDGEQTLSAVPGFLTGFDIDRLVLTSGSIANGTTLTRELPKVSTLKNSRTKIDLSISLPTF